MPDVSKQEHPEAIRMYREEESRYKADRKHVTRARRIVATKLKRQNSNAIESLSTLPVVCAYIAATFDLHIASFDSKVNEPIQREGSVRLLDRWGRPGHVWRESFSPVVERRDSDLFVSTELRDRQARRSKPLEAVRPLLGLRMITRHVQNSKGMRIAAPKATAS
jgi:hypothetical protein